MRSFSAIAKEIGFTDAAVIPTENIPFEPTFRTYCEANLCGQYGTNWSCPPDCGSPKMMKNRILAYPNAVVLHVRWHFDWRDRAAVKEAKTRCGEMIRWFVGELSGTRGFVVGVSGCSLCSPCTRIEGEPCRLPALQTSCMSAYCVHVAKLAERCSMPYGVEENTVDFFGMYVFEEC